MEPLSGLSRREFTHAAAALAFSLPLDEVASSESAPESARYEILTDDELIFSVGMEGTLYRPVNGQGLGEPLGGYTGTDMPTIETAGGPYPIEVIDGVEYFRLDGTIGWDVPSEWQSDEMVPFDPTTDSYLMRIGDLFSLDETI